MGQTCEFPHGQFQERNALQFGIVGQQLLRLKENSQIFFQNGSSNLFLNLAPPRTNGTQGFVNPGIRGIIANGENGFHSFPEFMAPAPVLPRLKVIFGLLVLGVADMAISVLDAVGSTNGGRIGELALVSMNDANDSSESSLLVAIVYPKRFVGSTAPTSTYQTRCFWISSMQNGSPLFLSRNLAPKI